MLRLKHKFGAKSCAREGIKFPSKAERAYYDKLLLLQKAGEVVGFFRQVPLDLPGGIRYVMDYLVFYADGTAEGVEVKGFETKEWVMKKKLVDETYPWLDLKVVKT